ncbi:hypothetical protein M9H77_05068 [Catharanthus roseus]|uniref:Uncharacterized protein n=1 Tax=Catharanthus roseus TaxID=4058 RepID=A0ACC0CFY3_CATRO|nr:hypothetical protein M9H77_05068 [Catharanthus roseus]
MAVGGRFEYINLVSSVFWLWHSTNTPVNLGINILKDCREFIQREFSGMIGACLIVAPISFRCTPMFGIQQYIAGGLCQTISFRDASMVCKPFINVFTRYLVLSAALSGFLSSWEPDVGELSTVFFT